MVKPIQEVELIRGVTYDECHGDDSCDTKMQKEPESSEQGDNVFKQENDLGSSCVVEQETLRGSEKTTQEILSTGENGGLQVCVVDPNARILDRELTRESSNSKIGLKRGVTYEDKNQGEGEKAKLFRYTGASGSGGSNVDELISKMLNNQGKYQLKSMPHRNVAVPAKSTIQMCDTMSSAGLNFHLFPNGRVLKISDTNAGEESVLYYLIEICVFLLNGMRQEFVAEVRSDKVRHSQWLSKFSHSLAIPPESKIEKKAFRAMVQKCIENDEKKTEVLYHRNGWRQIPQIGWRFVYSQGVVGQDVEYVRTIGQNYTLNLNTTILGTKQNFENVMSIFRLCKKQAASVGLFLYTIASLMATLFQEKGFPIKFVFGIAGVTNSRKTSMAVAVAQVFNRQELKADAEFSTATHGGIEKTMGKYKDGIAIIDDLKPGVNQTQRLELEKKIDKLIRFYGNRVEAKRMVSPPGTEMNSNYYPIGGGCVVTMEVPPTGDSTLTRMFLVEIGKDDVNDRVLSFFQKSYEALPCFYYAFLAWVTREVENVLDYIPRQMEYERDNNTFAVKRYSEMYATFAVTSQLVARYAISNGFFDTKQATDFCSSVSDMIKNELNLMGMKRQQRDKGNIVIEAIVEGIQNGEISPMQLTEDSCQACAECYVSDELYYIKSECLMKVVHNYEKGIGEKNTISKDDMLDLLEQKDVLDVKRLSNGRFEKSRKLPIQRGNHKRYLYIKKGSLYVM